MVLVLKVYQHNISQKYLYINLYCLKKEQFKQLLKAIKINNNLEDMKLFICATKWGLLFNKLSNLNFEN